MRHGRRALLPVLAALAAQCFVPGNAAAPEQVSAPSEMPEAVRVAVTETIRKEMRKNDVVGLSIAVVNERQVLWSEGFGYADKQAMVPASPDTPYRIGSLTRLFTAAAVMQLVEQGRLELDMPVRELVPGFSIRTRHEPERPVTVRDLLTHHSCLPTVLLKGAWGKRPADYRTVPALLREEYALCRPGTVFADSSVDSTLAGIIVERVSGREYRNFLRDVFFLPLGMHRSNIAGGMTGTVPATKAYRDGKEIEEPLPRDIPALGMVSTAHDLGVFLRMLLADGAVNAHRVMSPATLAEMVRLQNADVALDAGLRVGLGWALSGIGEIDIRNAGVVAHRAGATMLTHAQMILLPEQRLGVVVLANSASAARVVNRAAVQALTLLLESRTGTAQPTSERWIDSDQPLSARMVEEVAGRYASVAGLAEITARSDHFHASVMGRTLQLIPTREGTYGIKYLLLGFIPLSLGELDYYTVTRTMIDGREVLLAGMKGRFLPVAERLAAVPIPPAWHERTGEYRIDNLGDDHRIVESVTLKEDRGILVAELRVTFIKERLRFPLMPVSANEAVVAGIGYGLGGTLRARTVNGREVLAYSGYVLGKVER